MAFYFPSIRPGRGGTSRIFRQNRAAALSISTTWRPSHVKSTFLGSMLEIGTRSGTLSRELRRTPFCFKPAAHRDRRKIDLSPDPYLDRAFSRESRGRHRIKPLLVRFCGRPLLCRHSIVDRAFSRQLILSTAWLWVGWRSNNLACSGGQIASLACGEQ